MLISPLTVEDDGDNAMNAYRSSDVWTNGSTVRNQMSLVSKGPSDLRRVRLHGSSRLNRIYGMTSKSYSRRFSCNEKSFSTCGEFC